MKHLLLLSLLLLSSPVIGQETGVLFFREVNDKWGWFEDGNKDKDVKYIGEFKDGIFEDMKWGFYLVGCNGRESILP